MPLYLDNKHGVNPSLQVCFYCGEDMGVILHGKIPYKKRQAMEEAGMLSEDGRAPRRMVVDREPCNTCKEHMKLGVMLVEVKDTEDINDPVPTGTRAVIRDEAIRRMPLDEAFIGDIISKRMAFVPGTVWDMMGLPRENKG